MKCRFRNSGLPKHVLNKTHLTNSHQSKVKPSCSYRRHYVTDDERAEQLDDARWGGDEPRAEDVQGARPSWLQGAAEHPRQFQAHKQGSGQVRALGGRRGSPQIEAGVGRGNRTGQVVAHERLHAVHVWLRRSDLQHDGRRHAPHRSHQGHYFDSAVKGNRTHPAAGHIRRLPTHVDGARHLQVLEHGPPPDREQRLARMETAESGEYLALSPSFFFEFRLTISPP
ncbi:hypothetical protein L7F22_042378 [Adiantum nelumboides]|nr:hypothetical protein [Adiantum nelumboides]